MKICSTSKIGMSGLVFGKEDVNKGSQVVNNLVWLHCVMWFVHFGPEIDIIIKSKAVYTQFQNIFTCLYFPVLTRIPLTPAFWAPPTSETTSSPTITTLTWHN